MRWQTSLISCGSRVLCGGILALLWLGPVQSAWGEDSTSSSKVGVVAGRVTYKGEVPRAKVADNQGHRHPLLHVARRSGGVKYVVAFLKSRGVSEVPTLKPSERPPLTINQVDHAFQPHLVAIRDGQKIRFTNSDAANHNVRSIAFERENEFNVFTGAGDDYVHQFVAGKEGRPIAIECNLHPWMKAWVYVFRDTRFAVTDKNGRYRIANIPIGEYDLQFLQPDVNLRRTAKITVVANKECLFDLEVTSKDLSVPSASP